MQSFRRPQNTDRRLRLERAAAESGLTINQVIYRWMIQSDPQVIPLVAVSRMEHLKEDLAAAELELCRQSMDLLNWPIDPIE